MIQSCATCHEIIQEHAIAGLCPSCAAHRVECYDDLLSACEAAQEFLESGSGGLDEHQRHEARVKALLDAAV